MFQNSSAASLAVIILSVKHSYYNDTLLQPMFLSVMYQLEHHLGWRMGKKFTTPSLCPLLCYWLAILAFG